MKIKRIIQLTAGLAITAAGLYVFLRGSDMGQLARELRSADPYALLLCCGMSILSLVLRAIRWRIMLPQVEGAHTKNLFSHTAIGFMVNNILPARAGEAARALLLWRKNGYSPAVSVGSLVLERLVDVLVFTLFFAVPALLLPELDAIRKPGWIALFVAASGMAVLALCCRFPSILKKGVGLGCAVTPQRFHHRILAIGKDLASVLDWSHSPSRLAWMIVLSILTPLCYSVNAMVLAGNPGTFGMLHGSFVTAFGVLGAAIPLAPGYVGTLHATVLQSFLLLGLESEAGRAMAVLFHAVGYVPVTIVGLIYFFRTDMSLGEISRAKETLND